MPAPIFRLGQVFAKRGRAIGGCAALIATSRGERDLSECVIPVKAGIQMPRTARFKALTLSPSKGERSHQR